MHDIPVSTEKNEVPAAIPPAAESLALAATQSTIQNPACKLTAYQINSDDFAPIRPARRERRWIEELDQKYAYRCLPLLVANQYGWEILSTHHFRASWDGSSSCDGLRVENLYGDGRLHCKSHFGWGVLTFQMPFVFKTSEGWDLYVRGPTNSPKDGIIALDGIIETDWAPSTFTMNWRFTRACTVEFEVGEPICLLFPVQRGSLERFDTEICMLETNSELHAKYNEWRGSRDRFLKGLREKEPEIVRQGWQKDYVLASKEKRPQLREFARNPDNTK